MMQARLVYSHLEVGRVDVRFGRMCFGTVKSGVMRIQ
jgi:hypothetical protein